jgi:hypothetical protein
VYYEKTYNSFSLLFNVLYTSLNTDQPNRRLSKFWLYNLFIITWQHAMWENLSYKYNQIYDSIGPFVEFMKKLYFEIIFILDISAPSIIEF